MAETKRVKDRKRALRRAGGGMGSGPASGGGERVARAAGQALSSRKISPAARTVASMSLSVCASDTNAASNWAGGK